MKGETWYHKRIPPLFFNPCRPLYQALYPAKLIVLVVAFVCWVAGVLILIGTFIACVAASCTAGVFGSILPLAALLMMLGYCLFHCAWAAYLLDEPDTNVYLHQQHPEEIVVVEPEPTDRLVGSEAVDSAPSEYGPVPEEGPPDPMKYGHWKFVPDSPWQNKCSRDVLQ